MISVLDTTAFSAAMRYEETLMRYLRSRRPGDVATVEPVIAEVEYGIQRLPEGSRRRRLLADEKQRLLEAIRVLSWRPNASVLFGEMKAHLENAGTPVDDFEILIAAIAHSHGAEIITANLAHFLRIPGITARHWEP